MPLQSEIVSNKPLASHEFRQIIENHVHDILGKDGLFTGQIAYGRVSYKITVEVLCDAFQMKPHIATITSRRPANDQIAKSPELGSVEIHPMKEPSKDAIVTAHERVGEITSPNLARIEHDLPLSAGMPKRYPGVLEPGAEPVKEKMIAYAASEMPARATPEYVDTDVSEAAAKRLGLLADQMGTTVEELRATLSAEELEQWQESTEEARVAGGQTNG